MTSESEFRPPNTVERELLNRLLEATFPGREELIPILKNIQVRMIDEMGSLELLPRSDRRAEVVKRIPVEAESADEDGVVIHVLLHVIDGRPSELEIFKEDGSSVKRMPPAARFETTVLPPVSGRRFNT